MSALDPKNLAGMRQNYAGGALTESAVDPDPLVQFEIWIREALESGIVEPNAMMVATASPTGAVASRMMLLKGIDKGGFIFFTNYESDKARDLEANPQAALLFFWDLLFRQVRVTGRVSKIARAETEAYFATRPYESRIGAWASHQSQPVPDRSVLDAEYDRLDAQYKGGPVPAPPFWGGYRLIPNAVEFWQGRLARLHDRLRYRRPTGSDQWIIERLSP